jgi:hypothetical protein
VAVGVAVGVLVAVGGGAVGAAVMLGAAGGLVGTSATLVAAGGLLGFGVAVTTIGVGAARVIPKGGQRRLSVIASKPPTTATSRISKTSEPKGVSLPINRRTL